MSRLLRSNVALMYGTDSMSGNKGVTETEEIEVNAKNLSVVPPLRVLAAPCLPDLSLE